MNILLWSALMSTFALFAVVIAREELANGDEELFAALLLGLDTKHCIMICF
jgi:hypothetical protein